MTSVTSYLLYLYAESPVHAGGPDAEGAVDLPIQRESATGYPLVWGQSLKGALRQAAYDAKWHEYADNGVSFIDEVFGRAVKGEEDGPGIAAHAGLLTVGDAQLVALPVPALHRTFAWATSPLALSRLTRKHAHARTGQQLPPVPRVRPEAGVCATESWADDGQVLGPCLVPLVRAVDGEENPASAWADLIAREGIGDSAHLSVFADKFREDLVVVGEDVMGHLLRECTEHAVRVQLDPETKTVQNGPFTSEYLPTETLLASVLTLRGHRNGDDHQQMLTDLLDNTVVQVGGDETLGKGLLWSRLIKAVPGE